MVRESITTGDCFSRAVNEPMGVGCLGLPIDAGICRTTWPSMLTVNVWASMSATPTTADPVVKSSFASPAVTEIVEWAGHCPRGVHRTDFWSNHWNVPSDSRSPSADDENAMARCAAARLATGRTKVTVTGIPTPTT